MPVRDPNPVRHPSLLFLTPIDIVAVRRIPGLPAAVGPAPSLRKIIKNLPFANGQSKQRINQLSQPPDFVCPESSTLSNGDIAQDPKFLPQNWRHTNYESRESRYKNLNAQAPNVAYHQNPDAQNGFGFYMNPANDPARQTYGY